MPRACRYFPVAVLIALSGTLGGCEGSGSNTVYTSTSYYSGPGWHDPYYYGACCYNGGVIVRPPPGHRPPHVRPPIARPPGGRPGMPSRPRPRRR